MGAPRHRLHRLFFCRLGRGGMVHALGPPAWICPIRYLPHFAGCRSTAMGGAPLTGTTPANSHFFVLQADFAIMELLRFLRGRLAREGFSVFAGGRFRLMKFIVRVLVPTRNRRLNELVGLLLFASAA